MKKLKVLLLILVAIIASGLVFQKQLTTHLKIILFISEEFPQIPVKPLGIMSLRPFRQGLEITSPNGKIVGDLFLPVEPGKKPAVILAMGVKTNGKDKPLLWHFGDTMARLGYVVFWPRLELLDRGESLPEEPETFLESFKYLEGNPSTSLRVDKSRITFVGFSVGSSTSFVAASNPEISDKVHALVFFGGQFDIFEYFKNLASKTYQINGQMVKWEVADDARNHAKGLLEVKEATQTAKIFEESDVEIIKNIIEAAPTEKEKEGLKRYSPKEYVGKFKARIFILHDKSDMYVPYVESVKLHQALSKEQIGAYHISDLFEHVQPNRPIKIGELLKLYGFLYKVFNYL